jgi:hypothetical protein
MIERNKLFEDYNRYKEIDAVNFHKLWEIYNNSLLHYEVKEKEREATESQILGQIIHLYLLENVDLNDLVLVTPKLDKRKKEDKEKYEQLLRESEETYKYIISEEDHHNILNMYGSFHAIISSYESYSDIKKCIDKGKKEYNLLYDYKIDEHIIKVKSRLDCVKDNVILDLKTTISANPRNFIYDINRYGYRYQCIFYALGYSIVNNIDINDIELYIVAIEKCPPYDMSLYKIIPTKEDFAVIDDMFRKYIFQMDNPKYSGYTKEIIHI